MSTQKPNPETCPKCPHRYSKVGCPCWITAEFGFIETNVATGEERIVTGCFYQVLPKLMMHVVAASNRPAAAFEQLTDKVAKGFRAVATRQIMDQMEKEQGLLSG